MGDATTDVGKPVQQSTVVFSIIAIACAGAELTAVLLSLAFRLFAGPRADLSDRLDNFIFDYGFVLLICAVFFGLIGILFGGRSRRLGFVAIAMVAAFFLLMIV